MLLSLYDRSRAPPEHRISASYRLTGRLKTFFRYTFRCYVTCGRAVRSLTPRAESRGASCVTMSGNLHARGGDHGDDYEGADHLTLLREPDASGEPTVYSHQYHWIRPVSQEMTRLYATDHVRFVSRAAYFLTGPCCGNAMTLGRSVHVGR